MLMPLFFIYFDVDENNRTRIYQSQTTSSRKIDRISKMAFHIHYIYSLFLAVIVWVTLFKNIGFEYTLSNTYRSFSLA
jgi:uncharacterized membrane protein